MFSTFFLTYPSCFQLKCFYSDFGPSALRLRMQESADIFCSLWRMIWERHARTPHIEAVFRLMFVVNIESAKKQQSNKENIHSSTSVYLVSLDYEISVPHINHSRLLIWFLSLHWKGQKRGKSLTSRKKTGKRRNNSPNLTLFMLGFPKKKGWKNCWFWPSVLL